LVDAYGIALNPKVVKEDHILIILNHQINSENFLFIILYLFVKW